MRSSRYSNGSFLEMRGATLIELLASLLIFSLIFTSAFSSFFDAIRRSYDHETISRAEDTARTIRDRMVAELRFAGTGLPLGQTNFLPGGAGLGDAPLAMLLDSDNSLLHFRSDLSLSSSVLTTAFTPSAISLTFNVVSATAFAEGDTIYITNMPVLGSDGFQGVIASISGSTIEVEPTYVASSVATFDVGSIVNRVREITFVAQSGWQGITRDGGNGSVTLQTNATFVIEYYDRAGNSLALPLTDSIVADELSSVEVAVYVRGEKPLDDGTTYTAVSTEQVALRNLILSRD